MKKIALFTVVFSIGLQSLFAQSKEITGKVISAEDGSSIPGVSVSVKGTVLGTTTDQNGKFKLNVPQDAQTLVFSFIGLKTIEKEIKGLAVNATLGKENVSIDEVVVVAYGTKTKRSITGAVASVGSDVLDNQTAISPLRAIQGSAPGVNVITTGGQPGESPTLRIRGIGSVNASAAPLIVVDGVVFSGDLNTISANQIESINVLKDASASALYGSRAANGVILVTTKNGNYTNKETKITVNARFGFSNPAVKTYELVSASSYMKYAWESIKNREIYVNKASDVAAAQTATDELISTLKYNPYSLSKPVGTDGKIASGANLLWKSDWHDALTRSNAAYNEYTLSTNGGSDNIAYFITGNYLDQNGAIIASNFQRYTGRANIKAKLKDWIELATNNSFSKSTQNFPNQEGTAYQSSMQWIYTVSSIYPLFARDANGNFKFDSNGDKIYDYGNAGGGQLINAVRPILGGENIVSSNLINDIRYTRSNLFSSSHLKIDLFKDLYLKTTLGYERYLYDSYQYDNNKYGSAASVKGRVDQERTITESTTLTNTLDYRKIIHDHSIHVDLITETFNYNYDLLSAQATGFLPNVKVLSGSTVPEGVEGYVNSERLVSYLARADYNYKSRYFIDFSFRTDGSSRFAKENRWGNFYSIGGSWILSDEKFMASLAKKVSLLKLRGSYGELGNNRGIGYFPFLATYSTGWNNNDHTGVLQAGVVDPNITWEKTSIIDVALDFGFLENRITGTLEYYNKKSIDLLFDKPLSPSTGDIAVTTNAGTIRNSGLEFSLNTVNIHSKAIYWTSSFNISSNKNVLLKLPQEEIIVGTKKWMAGKSIYDFYIREYAGVDPADGSALWYKDDHETGKKVVTKSYGDATRYYQGSALPKAVGGFSTFFKFKYFDVHALFNFSFGGKIYDYDYASLMNSLEAVGSQLSADIVNRWQKPGDITDVPKLITSNNDYNATSTRFLFDNNYLRLKALSVGYNLPHTISSKINISNCRFFLQADNIWTLQSHKGLDPEQDFEGVTNSRSNMLKTVSLGINLEL